MVDVVISAKNFNYVKRRWIWILALTSGLIGNAIAQPFGHCRFDPKNLQFQGDAMVQASCLLRHVAKWGKVDAVPATLPPMLSNIIGKPTGTLITQLRTYLSDRGLKEASLGGALSQGVSHAHGGSISAPPAQYFVIHDTSSPWLGDTAFPPDNDAELNSLKGYGGPNAVAHVFINRLGSTLTGHDFVEPWRATKLESQVIGMSAKGLFVHVELLQPRRRDPAGSQENDALAPQPGFTAAQYDSLALLYAVASARSGKWLIPAFHAAIDEGLTDSHDDPQNFELEHFATALTTLLEQLSETVLTTPPDLVPAAAMEPRAQVCSAIITGLAALKPGEPLLVRGGQGQAWKTLFDECDRTDTFAGLRLPKHEGRQLRCTSERNRVAILNHYADGTVVFNAKASVDADGSPVIGGSGWPNNVQTWLTFDEGSQDKFVNAEAVPFIVIPQDVPKAGMSLMTDTGIGKGDLAVVVKGDRCSFAVVGDAGPWFRLGEASLRAHEDLGNPQCAISDQSPCRHLKEGSGVGITSNVTFIVFPGSRPKPLLSQTVNAVVEREAGKRVLQFLSNQASRLEGQP
ncbi:glycoside hydrolase family 75 protein [Ralstonia pseudosolanacearum]|uniref:glycoside hydrolase family 75 protein n=1 Tax=Ralstonia pseudosolanacearum TaxID=1310165 RepID=UPI001C8C772E|nr:glycoside hydrolase family 75 protein [Ralstonia pseudosolanacearum]MBX9432106.1 glycoside hydrolase family 75 protein [Ralstonia pseudosolanacearum]